MGKWIATQVWDVIEGTYSLTGLRIQAPIEFFWPSFAPWLFGKMIGSKPTKLASKGGQ